MCTYHQRFAFSFLSQTIVALPCDVQKTGQELVITILNAYLSAPLRNFDGIVVEFGYTQFPCVIVGNEGEMRGKYRQAVIVLLHILEQLLIQAERLGVISAFGVYSRNLVDDLRFLYAVPPDTQLGTVSRRDRRSNSKHSSRL